MGNRRQVSDEQRLEAAVNGARATLEAKGLVTGSKLGPIALRPQVMQRLCSEGYEPTAAGLRVPLATQGRKLMALGDPVALTDLRKRLAGANSAEANALAEQLCGEGKAHFVLRGKKAYLSPPGEGVLDRGALKVLAQKLKATAAWVEKASKNKVSMSVLMADLTTELGALTELVRASTARVQPEAPNRKPNGAARMPLNVALRGAILALRDEDSRLASVPQVSRRLRERATANEVIDVLLSEFGEGRIELRPEGGIGRLSVEDKALCPKGANELALSWVRLLEE